MLRSLLLCAVLSSPLLAADPPAIKFPAPPTPSPVPQPPPPVGAAMRVTADRVFAIQSDEPVIPLVSPKGLVKFTVEAGPIRVRGVFADGNGQVETRNLTAKWIIFAEPNTTGAGEILVLPKGVDDEGKVARQLIEAVNGPQPPPKPDEPPVPDAKSPIPGPGLKVLIVYETGKPLPPKQGSILDGQRVRDYLEANCVVGPDGRTKEYRIWDQNVELVDESQRWKDALKRTRAGVPWVVVGNATAGYEGPLPATVDEFLTLIKKYEVKQ